MGLNARSFPFLLAAAALVVAGFVLAPYRAVTFHRSDGETVRLPAPDRLSHLADAWDYLQIGRNVWEGRGYTSLFTYVPFLPESPPMEAAGPDSRPVRIFPAYWRQPVYPLLVAASFAVAGAPEPNAVLVLQALGMLALALGAYVLGRRFLDPPWAAAAAFWTLLSPPVLGIGGPLIATTWFAAWVAWFLAVLFRVRGRWAWFAVGLLLGVGAMLRLETWVLLPGFLVGLWLSARRGRLPALGLAAAGMILVILPWHWNLVALTGSPFYNKNGFLLLCQHTHAFPAWTAYRSLEVNPLTSFAFVTTHFSDVMGKGVINFLHFGKDLLFLPSVFLAPLFWLSVLRPPRDGATRAFLLAAATGTVLLVVLLSPVRHATRYVATVTPALAVGATITLARLPRYRRILAVTATVVGLVSLVGALSARQGGQTAATAARDMDRLLRRPEAAPLAEGAVLAGDAPTVYAWIWQRPAIWAPVAEDMEAVRERMGPVVAIVTCAETRQGVLEPDLAARYAKAGARIWSEGCAHLATWPQPGTATGGGPR